MTGRKIFLSLILMLTLLPGLWARPAAAQDAYRVRPGDTLRIEVIEDSSLNRTALVSPDGRITVPLAGSVRAAGRSVQQIQASLTEQLAPNFAATPSVYVGLEQLAERTPAAPRGPVEPATIDVYVMGEIATPGKLEVEPGTTLMQLFAQSKGFTRFAATKRIQLRRTEDGTQHIYPLNYDAILSGQSPNGRVTMMDGDVIVVPQRRLFE